MTCTVTVVSEVYEEIKDPATGFVTGHHFVTKDFAEVDQQIKVTAKMTGTCAGKIKISAESNTKDQTKPVEWKETHPATAVTQCTKEQTQIFWTTRAKIVFALKGQQALEPELTFTAPANCDGCNCAADSLTSSATVKQKVSGQS